MRLFPAFHIAELVAYALGAEEEELNLKSHKIPAAVLGAATPAAG